MLHIPSGITLTASAYPLKGICIKHPSLTVTYRMCPNALQSPPGSNRRSKDKTENIQWREKIQKYGENGKQQEGRRKNEEGGERVRSLLGLLLLLLLLYLGAAGSLWEDWCLFDHGCDGNVNRPVLL